MTESFHAPLTLTSETQDRLVLSRLGAHTGLFFALRAKHPPTAAHSLRVAIGCSKWGAWRGFDDRKLGLLEVAAVLHDVGKIGVPDEVLQKPGKLSEHEQLIMSMQNSVARELLCASGLTRDALAIVLGARHEFPLGELSAEHMECAGMLAIVDAFDSMTTEQVFRKAVSRERALGALFEAADEQFEPSLIEDFALLISEPRPQLDNDFQLRWLSELAPNGAFGFDQLDIASLSSAAQRDIDHIFHSRLMDTLVDGVVFLDSEDSILRWNRTAEQMTGRQASTMLHRRWTSALMGLKDQGGQSLSADKCPLAKLAATNILVSGRFLLESTAGSKLAVRLKAIPVISEAKERCGAILLFSDATTQTHLEQKFQSLHSIATLDPLTQVANRTELNRRLPQFLDSHLRDGKPGSLILCDIDYFKKINDTYGHQAGDDALVTFAGLLKESARNDDLVARFGGEEFIIVCAGCDNTSATTLAEQMRKTVEKTPIPSLKGRCATSSFGVTEIQAGDTPVTLLARADRALLLAKENGRNRVVQLGAGQDVPEEEVYPEIAMALPDMKTRTTWLSWFRGAGETLISSEYLAAVPREVAIQKLKGFINDHKAELISIEDSLVVIRVDGSHVSRRRSGERAVTMVMHVDIQTVDVCTNSGQHRAYQSRTMFKVSIRPYRTRDRRVTSLRGQAQHLLLSFQAYLVAQPIDDAMREVIIEPR